MPDSDATRPVRAIRGVLFDKDGTLLDYAATWMGANRAAALAAAGGDQELGERLLVIGGYDPDRGRVGANTALAAGNATEIAAVWLPLVNGWEPRDLADLLDRIFEEESQAQAAPVTELAPLFARLKGRGLKLGVATNDSQRGIEATLGPLRGARSARLQSRLRQRPRLQAGPGHGARFLRPHRTRAGRGRPWSATIGTIWRWASGPGPGWWSAC